MPLHDPHTTAASPTDEGLPPILAPDLPEPGQLTQLSGVVDILRLARAARQVSEELVHPLQGARPGSPRYGPPAHPSVASVSRSTTSASNAMARPYTSSSPRPGRRQDSSRYRHPHDSALPRYYSPPSRAESTSQLAAPRQEEVGPSNSGMLSANSNLSRTHLDSEDFSSRLSMLRANALLMRDDLERAMEELALPLYGPRSDIIPPRNHHRHSSMSMSPRVLETTHPNDASSHRRARNVEDKLEDVLFFLDTQRLRHPASPNQASCPLYFDKSLVSECSWLRLASKFQGFQTFKRPSVPTMSNISRQLHALQAFQTRDWKVDVVIDYIDYSNMSIAGSMTMLQSNEQQRVKIFWTGELIDFSSRHSLLTKNWTASAKDDIAHWRKLEPFKDFSDESLLDLLLSQSALNELCEKYILMRWKEQTFIDSTFSSEMTILGFYYCSLRRSDGMIEGFYWDPSTPPYQRITLKPATSRGDSAVGRRSFPVYAFR